MTEKISLLIPQELKKKLEKKSKQAGFDSLEAYMVLVLEQVVSGEDEIDDLDSNVSKKQTSEEDDLLSEMEETELKKSLAKLGYKV